MRALLFLLASIYVMGALPAQELPSHDQALKQLYRGYDAEKQAALWECTKEQKQHGMHPGWRCPEKAGTVSVSVLLIAGAREGETERTYLVSSAKPVADESGEYECHGCAPAIGLAVFARQGQRWVLESANLAMGFYGGWGNPPEVELVAVGPAKHGVLLSTSDMAQGYSWSAKSLFLPRGKTAAEAWSIQDENDNLGSIDPDDKDNSEVPYKQSAKIKFLASNHGRNGVSEYYDLEVISQGEDRQDSGHPIKPENWREVYRFRDCKYRLLLHTDLNEAKEPLRQIPPG